MTTPGSIGLETFLEPISEKVERRSAGRRPPPDDFSVFRWNGSRLTQEPVKDISSTGLYILTEERWPTGTLLSLTLQRPGPLEFNPERRIEVQAKVVRCGKDGVGLAFVFKDDSESRQWASLREHLVEQAKPEDMLSLVRLVESVAFLSRICPGKADNVRELLDGRLSKHKLANAVAIALKAENLLADEPIDGRQRANADLVIRILEDGSCSDEVWLNDFWGGLLATCCAVDPKDESSLFLLQSLSQFTTFLPRLRSYLRQPSGRPASPEL
jgi:hypothetical protein